MMKLMDDMLNLTWAMMVLSPVYMVHDLSPQLPLTLKSYFSSFVLAAKNTSNSVFNWKNDDFFAVKSKSLASELSPLYTCHLLCAVNI